MMAWIKRRIKAQWVDKSGVRPEHKFDKTTWKFFLDSGAGLIEYKPKTDLELQEFRNKYVNRFEMIKNEGDPEKRRELFFLLYEDIRRNVKRAKYRANLRTRFEGKVCGLKKSFSETL